VAEKLLIEVKDRLEHGAFVLLAVGWDEEELLKDSCL